ncbi:MAG: hypothetical protein II879_03300 [Clostridia bacterium]|nr:hypothetical protein [Clostridia bacterium]MBQ6325078.1 hypothetical protein [Clostridia bacterium]MBR2798362.1 hypothetical protein [Clostridia bacterium]
MLCANRIVVILTPGTACAKR